MRRLFDVTDELLNGNDFEIHTSRGKRWDTHLIEEFEFRKKQALGMFRERSNRNTVFRVARIAKLPIRVAREIEAQYKAEEAAKDGK